MTKLFDMIPNSFFNYLGSGSNNRIYAECLMLIYSEYENEISYRLPRTQIRDTVAYYLNEIHSDLTLEDGEIEKNYSDMASAIIRKFTDVEVGWLEEDNDEATYEKQIIMTEQGIMLAEFLERLRVPEKEEFSSYIFNIYNILQSREQWDSDPYALCLSSVYKNSRNLSKALKRLATFIRKIIEEMMNENSFESLTENIIAYCEGDFIKEYSRLTKRQNIHYYRSSIVNSIKAFENNQELFEVLIIGCALENNISEGEAKDKVLDMLHKTRHFLEHEYDAIMADIKHKINIYLQIAVGRGRFLRNKGADVRGSVEQTIKYIVEEMDELGMKDNMPEEYMNLFSLEKNEFIDLNSIRYPVKQRAIKKSTKQEYEILTDEDKLKAMQEQKKSAFNPYSKERMKQFLDKQLDSKISVCASELPLISKDDMLVSLSAVAYSMDNGYTITSKEGYVESNNMIIRDFEIRRDNK